MARGKSQHHAHRAAAFQRSYKLNYSILSHKQPSYSSPWLPKNKPNPRRPLSKNCEKRFFKLHFCCAFGKSNVRLSLRHSQICQLWAAALLNKDNKTAKESTEKATPHSLSANWELSLKYPHRKYSHLKWKGANIQHSLTAMGALRGFRPDCYSTVN